MLGLIKAGLVVLGQFLGIIQKGQDASHDANERQAGADAATVAGQNQSLKDIQDAKRVEVAMQSTTADPAWAERVHDRFTRPD
jgi:hypothetical protein